MAASDFTALQGTSGSTFFTQTVKIFLYIIRVHWPNLPLPRALSVDVSLCNKSSEINGAADKWWWVSGKDGVALATVRCVDETLVSWANERWREHFWVESWASLVLSSSVSFLDTHNKHHYSSMLIQLQLTSCKRELFLSKCTLFFRWLLLVFFSFIRSDLALSNLAFFFSLFALALETAWIESIDELKPISYLVCTSCGNIRQLTNAMLTA